MISGAHAVVYSTEPEGDRAFLRDVIGLPHVDSGDGWLIFALPPTELAVHPTEMGDGHQLLLLCDDIAAFVSSMTERGVACTPPEEATWGVITRITLPGGSLLGVYEPRHARPAPVRASTTAGTP